MENEIWRGIIFLWWILRKSIIATSRRQTFVYFSDDCPSEGMCTIIRKYSTPSVNLTEGSSWAGR